jgi:hypothetical protein
VPHDKKVKGKVTNILQQAAIFVESSPGVSDVYVDAKTWNGRKFKVGDTVHVLVVKHQKGNCQWRAVCFNDDAVVLESLAFIMTSNGVSSMPASSACAALYEQGPGSKLIVQTAGGLRKLIDACPKLVRYSFDDCGGTVRLVQADGDDAHPGLRPAAAAAMPVRTSQAPLPARTAAAAAAAAAEYLKARMHTGQLVTITGRVTSVTMGKMLFFMESQEGVSDVYVPDDIPWRERSPDYLSVSGQLISVFAMKHPHGRNYWRAVVGLEKNSSKAPGISPPTLTDPLLLKGTGATVEAILLDSLAFIMTSYGVKFMDASAACATLYKQCLGSQLIVQTEGGLRKLIETYPKFVRFYVDAFGSGRVQLVQADGDGSEVGEVADGFEVVSRSGVASAGRVPASFRHDQSAATPSTTVPKPPPAQEGNFRSKNVFSLLPGIDPAEKKTGREGACWRSAICTHAG